MALHCDNIASRPCSPTLYAQSACLVAVPSSQLYNEPYLATWGSGNAGTDWDLAVARLGTALLNQCPRWLLLAQGVGNNGGECRGASGYTCWWGENLIGQLSTPIRLSGHPDRLVLSPHVYGESPAASIFLNPGRAGDIYYDGLCEIATAMPAAKVPACRLPAAAFACALASASHLFTHLHRRPPLRSPSGHDLSKGYMSHPSFPSVCPTIWEAHWARVPADTGVPILVGEWGGVCNDTVWNWLSLPGTAQWQSTLVHFLRQRGVSWFYWTLNDNSFRTGSLFSAVQPSGSNTPAPAHEQPASAKVCSHLSSDRACR